MGPGRAKKIRQMIGYDVGADNIMGRQYQRTTRTGKHTTQVKCIGIRRSYRQLKKKINRKEG